nr:RNA polymerase sigma-70 factor [Allomuricauda sp.]
MMDFENNANLIKSLSAGEQTAFTYMVETYHHRLCVYANSLVNNSMQASDIVQNVLIQVWEKREKLNPDHSLKSFLYKSVYNEFIDQYRKKQALLKIEKKYIEYLDAFAMEKDNEQHDRLIAMVKRAILELPPKCKQVFELSKTEGLTNMEISEHLNISVKAVEAQITRGFRLLRKSISDKIKLMLFFLMRTS